MIQLLLIRDSIKNVVTKYNSAITPIFRFLAAFITFALINGNLGYNEKLTGISVIVLLSAISAFLPTGVTVFFAAMLMIVHIYILLQCFYHLYLLLLLLYFILC